MDAFWQGLMQSAPVYAGHIVGALVILLVGFLAMRFLMAPLRRLLTRSRVEASTASFLTNTVRGLLLVAIGIAFLQQLGVESASLLTVLAASGLAVALSLQNTLANFAAGLLLLFFRLARIGDVIETIGFRGRITDLLPFHVLLLTEDNEVATVPNSALIGSGFRNLTAHATRRVQWTLTLRNTDDLDAVRAALCGRLLVDQRLLKEPPPRVLVQEWREDTRVLTIQAWAEVGRYREAQEELLEPLGRALEEVRRIRS